MRRVMLLLALSTLVFPMAGFANPIGFDLQIGPPLTVGTFGGGNRGCVNVTDISCSTNNYFNGPSVSHANTWVLNLVGPTGRILLDITSLTTSTGATCNHLNGSSSTGTCNFSGTVTAFGASVPGGTFTDSISGTLTRGPNDTSTTTPHPWVMTTLTGELPATRFTEGTLSVDDVNFCRSEQPGQGCGPPGNTGRLRSGFGAATLDFDVIPEPGTLGLLGTGVIGLAGMARRRFKLGR